jgi:hypothetical protein
MRACSTRSIRQSGKPCPASLSEITTACLQDELEGDSSQVKLESGDNGAPMPKPDGDSRRLPSYFFACFSGGNLHPPSFLQLSTSSGYRESLLLCPGLRWTIHPRTRPSHSWRDRVNASQRSLNSISPTYPPKNPQRFLVSSALEPIKRVNRQTRLLGPKTKTNSITGA